MGIVWQCDRCEAIASSDEGGHELPSTWFTIHRPVRGSEGAKSVMEGVICSDCEDALYNWWRL